MKYPKRGAGTDSPAKRFVDKLLDEEETDGAADKLVVMIPTGLESPLEEGRWKRVNNTYDIRYDRRPANQGGDQLHIRHRDGSQWAYRQTGDRSEPRKYVLPATTAVKKIVRARFNVPGDKLIECRVEAATKRVCTIRVILKNPPAK